MIANHDLEIAIIGRGKVGTSLAQLFKLADFKPQLIGRGEQEQQAAIKRADVVILAVADRDIAPLCDYLSTHFKPGSIIAHCSGALTSESLDSAKKKNCDTASIHPLNSFPSLNAAMTTFSTLSHRSHAFAEGDQRALDRLIPLFEQIGFSTTELKTANKPLYHAACVFACNYLTVLLDVSLTTAEHSGLERDHFLDAIQPLIQSTLHNINQHGTADALSGPIARGDNNTVLNHLTFLAEHSTLYKVLGQQALTLATQRGNLTPEQINALTESLRT